jgi:hypothetical protein
VSVSEAATSTTDRVAARTKRPRSAVTSGRQQFITGNPNSAWARRFHDLIQGHVSDLGGRLAMSEAKLALAKRAAGLECELEQMEGRMSQGEEINLDSYGRAASHLRRLLEALGLDRKARDVSLLDGEVEALPWSPMRDRLRAAADEATKVEAAP